MSYICIDSHPFFFYAFLLTFEGASVLTSHTYRLLKGSSWGIVITLEGEVVPGTGISPGAVKITDGIWLEIDVGWRLSEEQVGRLQRGLLLVAPDIERTAGGGRPILARLTGLQYNPTDYQPEGLVAAVAEWAAQACGFPSPPISATFDRARRRYVFTFPPDAVDHWCPGGEGQRPGQAPALGGRDGPAGG
jgi:hypothetical protein